MSPFGCNSFLYLVPSTLSRSCSYFFAQHKGGLISQSSLMALEAYARSTPDTVHSDVLTQARQSCYKARDAFYACLEKESDKKPTEIASVGLLYPVECKQSRDEFVKQCRSSWVKHFDRQYCQNKRAQRLLDDKGSRRGPLSLPQPYTFKPTT